MQQKKDIKPLLKQLSMIEPSQNQELEILKFWFLDFLNSVEGVEKISVNYYQNPWGFYLFTFEYSGEEFKASTSGKDLIVIRDRSQEYCVHFNGDTNSNYFKLALAMAFKLKQAGKI